jgi:alanine racemase
MIFESDFGPHAIISAAALRHNLGVARKRAPQSKIMAIIKANAYGHGLVPTARALADADAFGVARLSEALLLRSHGLSQRLVLLEGVFSNEELQAAINHNLDIVVHSPEQLHMLRNWRGQPALQVWLKVDTGMNRLGFRVDDFLHAWTELKELKSIAALRVMTHLANADVANDVHTQHQLQCFNALTSALQVERSIGNSAGLLAWPQAHVEWVRPGLMLYGVSPFAHDEADHYQLKPAMTLQSRLIAIRQVKAGEPVGYSGTWRASRDSQIGIVAVGYGDGYPRLIQHGTPVRLGTKQLPIVGRVSMDMIAIDLSLYQSEEAGVGANVGDVVTLWGQGLPVERIAQCAGTIPYDLICGISQRVSVDYQ